MYWETVDSSESYSEVLEKISGTNDNLCGWLSENKANLVQNKLKRDRNEVIFVGYRQAETGCTEVRNPKLTKYAKQLLIDGEL